MPPATWKHKQGIRYIYGLLDIDGRERYIGQTANLQRRVNEHWKHRYGMKSSPLKDWLLTLSELPQIARLQTVTEGKQAANLAERCWIKSLSSLGYSLTNQQLNGWAPSEEHRQIISDAHQGLSKPKTPEHRQKISKSLTGKMLGVPHSEDHSRKISESLTGRKLTEEHCQKLSEAHRGKPTNPPRIECPTCGLITVPGAMTNHRRFKNH